MTHSAPIELDFRTDAGMGERGRLGLVVLASDRTIESEIRLLPLPGVAIHHSRIANDMHVTEETLLAMADRLPDAAALLPTEFDFDAIAYGCTSASTLIGDEGVQRAVQTAHQNVPVTNPIRAAIAAFEALGVRRIGVVTPYSQAVTLPVIERFERDGLSVSAFGSFLVEDDLIVSRISADSVLDGIEQVCQIAPCDAVFVSCTSVRSFQDVERFEDQVGRPVVSSNLAVAWHLLRLAGIDDRLTGFGQLLALESAQ